MLVRLPSVGGALAPCAPFFRFRCPEQVGDEVRIVLELGVALSDEERAPLLDLILLGSQALIEGQLGHPMRDGRFELPVPAPAHAARYPDFFHAPVRFGCGEAAIVIPARWLSVASRFADGELYQSALESARRGARRLPGDRLIAARVEQILAQRGARLGLRRVARLLGLSERTLMRRLRGEGTSYQLLVDASLKSCALALLRDQQLTVAEVAYALGYEDAANFGRAFRRWFGQSPGRFRAAEQHPEPVRRAG